MAVDVRLLEEPFDPGELVGPFTKAHPGMGGVCTFVGEVRAEEDVEALELIHYAPMTLPGMRNLADEAVSRFGVMGLLMVHRTGAMRPGESIVLVSACATHRRSAIDAVDYCMDHLKSDAWFWKREKSGGTWRWIEPREDDHRDLARWK